MCYGLRVDFRGELFPGSAALLALADEMREVRTICHCGKKATMVVRRGPTARPCATGRRCRSAATRPMSRSAGGTGGKRSATGPRAARPDPKLRRLAAPRHLSRPRQGRGPSDASGGSIFRTESETARPGIGTGCTSCRGQRRSRLYRNADARRTGLRKRLPHFLSENTPKGVRGTGRPPAGRPRRSRGRNQ